MRAGHGEIGEELLWASLGNSWVFTRWVYYSLLGASTVGPLLKREYECADVGAEGDRTHSGRGRGSHKVIGSRPNLRLYPSPGGGQVPGHRSALGADGLQGASAQVGLPYGSP